MTTASSQAVPSSTKPPRTAAPWLLLFGRPALFLLLQLLFTLGFSNHGLSQAVDLGAAWWPIAVTITNIICVLFMMDLFQSEGQSFWKIFRIRRENVKSDLRAFLAWLVVIAPVAFVPNILLAIWLFGNPQAGLDLLIRPLPQWAALTGIILFPITQGIAELSLYFFGVMPRIKAQGLPRWLAIGLPVLILSLQHVAIPFMPDTSYIIYRALMYLPFAILVGLILNWRPRLLPYLAILHVLMDLSFAIMLLGAAY